MNFKSKFADAALNGWLLSFIETAGSSQPTDSILLVSSSISSALASSTTINGMVTPFGAAIRAPFVPRSNIPIDLVNRLDSRLTKTFGLGESRNLALNFEVFNVFNTISNTSVINTAYRAVGSVITAQPNVGNGTASGGFPDGTNARRAQVSARFTF